MEPGFVGNQGTVLLPSPFHENNAGLAQEMLPSILAPPGMHPGIASDHLHQDLPDFHQNGDIGIVFTRPRWASLQFEPVHSLIEFHSAAQTSCKQSTTGSFDFALSEFRISRKAHIYIWHFGKVYTSTTYSHYKFSILLDLKLVGLEKLW